MVNIATVLRGILTKLSTRINPITSVEDDTVTNWAELGSGIFFFNTTCLNNQPHQYGFVRNQVSGKYVTQEFHSMSGSSCIYYRSGNKTYTKTTTGWYTGSQNWTKSLDVANTKVSSNSIIIGNLGIEWGYTDSLSLAANSYVETQITFTLPFKSTPVISPTLSGTTSYPNLFPCNGYNVTTTGFKFNFRSTYSQEVTVHGRWLAIGEVTV